MQKFTISFSNIEEIWK